VAAATRRPEPSSWNLPNALTTSRILLVPVFGWLLLYDNGSQFVYRVLAFVVFVAATLTDQLDGHIARSRDQVTNFGKLVDPLADKALTGVGFVGLSVLGELSWWVTCIVLARELLITALRVWYIRSGVIISASPGGKLKTILQAVALAGYVLPLGGLWHTVSAAVMAAAVIVTIASGVQYLRHGYLASKHRSAPEGSLSA
jgi:CDP-diacylglycerol--glycerol-3-phosphate 3-phosphatidyltransferase